MWPRLVGSLAASFSFGALAWVFLIQAPLLSRSLGRDRFVPLQMALMKPLLAVMGVASVAMLLSSTGHHPLLLGAGSLLATVLAAVIAPRALKAGGQSLKQALETDASHSAGRFLADGGGDATRWLHRALGLSVVAALGTQVAWVALPAEHAHEHEHGVPVAVTTSKYAANPETVAAVKAMQARVEQGLISAPSNGGALAEALQADYALIFARCTMTGEAHEALHGFLLPLGDELSALAKTSDVEATRERLERLKRHLDGFSTQFE